MQHSRTTISLLLLHWIGILLCGSVVGRAQESVRDAPQLEPELYRWRIENARFGRVEISADGGVHYLLVGRVSHPATAATEEKGASMGGLVLRTASAGVVFSVGERRALRLCFLPPPGIHGKPSAAHRPSEFLRPSDVVTNLNALSGAARLLLPPPQSSAGLQMAQPFLRPFPALYTPSDADVFVLSVPPPTDQDAIRLAQTQVDVRFQIQTLARHYADTVTDRARQEKHSVVSGVLTLNAKLPSGGSEPITAVSYVIDDDVIAAKNYPPFSFAWDTTRVPNGEHVVEIRGLSENGNLISRARTLVVVKNN